MRSVAKEAGVSLGLVNYHFESTGELLWLAAVHGYDRHVERQRQQVMAAQRLVDLRNKLSEMLNLPPDKAACTGCRSIDGYCPVIGEQCATWVCVSSKGLEL